MAYIPIRCACLVNSLFCQAFGVKLISKRPIDTSWTGKVICRICGATGN